MQIRFLRSIPNPINIPFMKKTFIASVLFLAFGVQAAILPSGVQVDVATSGTGAQPSATSVVTVHYKGTKVDGSEFDSSYRRGKPASFPLNRVIPCWTEAMQTLKVGTKARITCPGNTAYGTQGIPGLIEPNAKLIFDVELLGVQ